MDAEKYQAITTKYLDIVYRAALNYCKNVYDAQDAVQNTFIKLYTTETVFEDDEHIRKWLIKVAVNECKSMWRSFWRKNVSYLDENFDDEIPDESRNKELFDEVMKLPPKYSIVIHLYYYENYSVKEISDVLDITQTNVQTRLMRARNKLKEQLKEAWQ